MVVEVEGWVRWVVLLGCGWVWGGDVDDDWVGEEGVCGEVGV